MLYALILSLCILCKCLLNQGSDWRVLSLFCGMCVLIVSWILSRSLFQFALAELEQGSLSRNSSRKSAKSRDMAPMSALLYTKMFLGFCFWVFGFMFALTSTISWSLRPGTTRVRVIRDALFVRNKSRMLDVTPCLICGLFLATLTCVRVGSSTVCVSEWVLIMSRKYSWSGLLSVLG